jgi:N-methylhydantoinase A
VYTIAVDIGGTFTDIVVSEDASGRIHHAKVLTTPRDLLEGVVCGVQQAAAEVGVEVSELLAGTTRFVHATTQSINAILTYTGARTAIVTTRGFGDTLTIMRGTGRVAGLSVWERHHYRMTNKPRLLADERDIFEVTERIDYKGAIITPLDESGVRALAGEIRRGRYEAIAVVFLFSFKNPVHEQRVREILQEELPAVYICLSCEVAPTLGEYERGATTLFNAYVGPVIEGYLARLSSTLAEKGFRHTVQIVQSNGGLTSVDQTMPIYTIESGPAAGVIAAAHLGIKLGFPNLIATDVGGTTFKVALVEDGQWSYSREAILNQYQLRLPIVDLVSIGAGGVSIAWVDGLRLKVGPQSAGAFPGPACYDFGGSLPTVTDADVVLGYISPENFLGGRMKLRADLATRAIDIHVATPLFGGDVLMAAAGIRQVVDNQMADLIRKVTLQRGHDPRQFVGMAYGGAGPAHAVSYGAEAGLSTIIVPYYATVHSAYGAAITDVRYTLQKSDLMVLPVNPERVEAIYADMEARSERLLDQADVPVQQRVFFRWLEARYRRQVYTVKVDVPSRLDDDSLSAVAASFEAKYERLFGPGSAYHDAGIELVNYGIDAVGRVKRSNPRRDAVPGTAGPRTHRLAYSAQQRRLLDTPVYSGPSLPAGAVVAGLAIVEHPGTTILVPERYTARIDEYGHTHICADK